MAARYQMDGQMDFPPTDLLYGERFREPGDKRAREVRNSPELSYDMIEDAKEY